MMNMSGLVGVSVHDTKTVSASKERAKCERYSHEMLCRNMNNVQQRDTDRRKRYIHK